MNWKRLWYFVLFAKLLIACLLPLSNDEAYYWVWGQVPQLSYYDHPPFIAWLFYLARPLDEIRLALPFMDGIVRWPSVVMGHLSLYVLVHFLSQSITEKQKFYAVLLLSFSPFFGIGSIVATPDIPFVFFWSLSLWALARLIKEPTVINAAFTGAALGLGFCSKYIIVVFVIIAILYLVCHRQWSIFRPQIILTVIIVGLVFSLPVLVWNSQNDWISFRFQLAHGLDAGSRTIGERFDQFTEYLGGQAALLGPLLLILLRPKAYRQFGNEISMLPWFGWGPILFFAWSSTRSAVEANWPIAGHLSLIAFCTILMAQETKQPSDKLSKLFRATLSLWILAHLVVLYQSSRPGKDLLGVRADQLKTYEFVRFAPIVKYLKENPIDTPIFASSYQMAGALSFASHKVVPKLAGISRIDFFDTYAPSYPANLKLANFTIIFAKEPPAKYTWPRWIDDGGYKEVSRSQQDGFFVVRFQTDN